ncbi:hypothetical protein EV126DRAFT_194516 [Verticillium dahliae]|nr:hypothetical protein EV126DRAFT_194516 [Verticillium dahliae]
MATVRYLTLYLVGTLGRTAGLLTWRFGPLARPASGTSTPLSILPSPPGNHERPRDRAKSCHAPSNSTIIVKTRYRLRLARYINEYQPALLGLPRPAYTLRLSAAVLWEVHPEGHQLPRVLLHQTHQMAPATRLDCCATDHIPACYSLQVINSPG